MCMKEAAEAHFERKCFLCWKQRDFIHELIWGWRPQTPSLHCVYVCVLFLQTVIVIPLAQTLIAVMAQDIVNVRRERQGLSAMSVCQDICGTMAANVSRTSTQPAASVPCSLLRFSTPPSFLLSLFLFSLFAASFWLTREWAAWFAYSTWKKKLKKSWTDFCHTCYAALLMV